MVKSFYVPILNVRKVFLFLIALNLITTILTWIHGLRPQYLIFFLGLYLTYIWFEEGRRAYENQKTILKHIIEAYFYLIFAIAVFVFSLQFAQEVIVVAIDCAPAISRTLNQDCSHLDFYDDSDIRYFLAALVAFLALLVILCILHKL